MADRTIKILEPATSTALLTLDELKTALGIPLTDTSRDAQLQMLIDSYSDVIAVMCNRTFAKEKVAETWRGDPPPYENYRVHLSHYPIAEGDVESVNAPDGTLIDPANYEVESDSGKLTLLGSLGGSAESIVVTYTGGYELPTDAPPALKAALQLMVQAGAAQLARGLNTGVRSISHKDARVMYFDPNATASKGGSSGKGPLIGGDTIGALLSAYMRFEV
jgi:hypothetical protein